MMNWLEFARSELAKLNANRCIAHEPSRTEKGESDTHPAISNGTIGSTPLATIGDKLPENTGIMRSSGKTEPLGIDGESALFNANAEKKKEKEEERSTLNSTYIQRYASNSKADELFEKKSAMPFPLEAQQRGGFSEVAGQEGVKDVALSGQINAAIAINTVAAGGGGQRVFQKSARKGTAITAVRSDFEAGPPIKLVVPGGLPQAVMPNEIKSFSYITDLNQALASIRDLNGLAGLDFETTGLDPRHDRPRLLSLADQSGKNLVIDLFEIGGLPNLREVLASLQVVVHNAMFDLSFLRVAGINLTGDCTMIAAHVLTGQPLSLKDAVKQFLQIDIEKDHQQSDWYAPKLSDEQLRYAALDAQLALKLFLVLKVRLIESEALVSYEVTRDAQPAIIAMRLAGFAIDAKGHAQLVGDLSAKHSLLKAELSAKQPDLNPNSPQQLDQWLRSVAPAKSLSSMPKTSGGQLKTGRDDLIRVASLLPPQAQTLLLDTLLPLKIVEKQLSTFGESFKKHIENDGRIRANFKLCSAVTGRMSCANPNLQQIPRDSSFRQLFRAPEGRVLVIADFSQIELRVIAELAGEKKLQAIYREGGDVHNLTASLLLGKSLNELSKDDRQLAKAVNFGLIFGQGSRGLSHYAQASFNITMSEAQANDYRAKWFKTYPDIAAWHRHVEAEAQRSLEIRTPLGRKRTWTTKHEFKVTEAYNFPVQGGAAEIMLASVKYLMDGLSNMDAVPVAVIHDEIIVETIPELANNVKMIVEQSMLAGFRAVLPNAPVNGLVEAKVAKSWAGK